MYPIRCFTCRKVLGNLWELYYILTEKRCIVDSHIKYNKKGKGKVVMTDHQQRIHEVLEYYCLDDAVSKPQACDLLGVERKCCRSVMFTTQVYEF